MFLIFNSTVAVLQIFQHDTTLYTFLSSYLWLQGTLPKAVYCTDCLTIQGRVTVTTELFMITQMLRSDMTNIVEPIYHQVFPLMWYSRSLSDPLHSLPSPPHSPWLSGHCLTTRNTPLMQQIAGAQAEAIPKLPMQQGEWRAPHSMWKWATATFKCESEKKSEKDGEQGESARERETEGGKRQCVCHNKLLSMTKQPWPASNTAPDTRVSLCMCMRVHPFVHPSVQDPKLTSKYSPCF